MALTLCSSKQVGSLTFNLHKRCYFSHNDILIYIHSFGFFLSTFYILFTYNIFFLSWNSVITEPQTQVVFYCTTVLTQLSIHAKLLLLLKFYLLKIVCFMAFFFAIGNILSYILCYFAFITFSEVFF